MNLNSTSPSSQQADVTLSSPLPWDTPNDNIGAMIVPTFILFGICGIGVIGNFCLAWVTFNGSHFRSVCYTFIALNAMSAIVLELWNLSYIYYVIFAKYSTIMDCWAIGVVPTYCMNISIMLTVLTSADRLFALVASKLYCKLSKLRYLTITIAISIITSTCWVFLSSYQMESQASKPAICVFHNYIQDYVAVSHAISYFVISIGLLLVHCYLCKHYTCTNFSLRNFSRRKT
uniref:G-protein coupled receptors family 1 profile domain-containing protein n=1 Tax=Acrobeloides nanus TaxID=290746 RepID=A0A914D023_9BILA